MVLASRLSDRYKNRGWPCQVGWAMCVVAFAVYLGCDPKNSPARFVALVLAEVGHYSEWYFGHPCHGTADISLYAFDYCMGFQQRW